MHRLNGRFIVVALSVILLHGCGGSGSSSGGTLPRAAGVASPMAGPLVLTRAILATLPHAQFARAHSLVRMPMLPASGSRGLRPNSSVGSTNEEEAAGTQISGAYTGIYGQQTAYLASDFPLQYPDAGGANTQYLWAPLAFPPGGSCLGAGTTAVNSGSGAQTEFDVWNTCNNGAMIVEQPINAAFISTYVSTNAHGLSVYALEIFTPDAQPSSTSTWYVTLHNNSTNTWDIIASQVGLDSNATFGFDAYVSVYQHGACPTGLPVVGADNIQLLDPSTQTYVAATSAGSGTAASAVNPGDYVSANCFTTDASGGATDIFAMVNPNNFWIAISTPIAHNSWTTTKAPMPTARTGPAAGLINGVLYAVGGYNSNNNPGCGGDCNVVEAYDPVANSWTAKAPMPTKRSYLAAGVINGVLYAVGGNCGGACPVVEAYDPVANSWTGKASMPTARGYLAAGVINGRLYAVGGYNPSPSSCGGPCHVVEAYDPVANSWTAKAPMPTARYGFAAGVINGVLYAAGGYNAATCGLAGPCNVVEAYDPVANSWTAKAPMPAARYYLADGVINGVLYAVGGFNGSSCGGYCNVVEAYDPVTNSWTTKAPMPTATEAFAAGVVDGTFFAVGGYDGGSVLNTVRAYTP